jgi:hypothetical protein
MVELANESTKLKSEVSKLSEDLNQMAIKNLKLEDSKAFRGKSDKLMLKTFFRF